MLRRIGLALAAAAFLAPAAPRAEISDGVVRVAVMNDISGVFQDYNGPGSVMAARMAAEDFAARTGNARGIRVEIVSGDHQNRPDVGSTLARRWLDVERVDAIVDVPNSAVALAVNGIVRNTRMALLASSTATSALTGAQCSPNAVQWVTDTWAIANATVTPLLERGVREFYFLAVDFALGLSIVNDATAQIETRGGRVLGTARHPLGTTDYAAFLLQAQRSRAPAVVFANAGTDTSNSIRQAVEFGLRRGGQQLVSTLMFIQDVQALGLETAQGLQLVEAFYWDLTDDTRAWSRRFAERMGGRLPSSNHAGVYSATLAYLNAVAAAGSDDARMALPEMRRAPIADPLFGDVTVRADGRAVHSMHLFEVKRPQDSRGPGDVYRLVQTIPAERAFRPLAEGGCALVR
jgi:branched-chain amino acid transport system substrate-binding protein